MEKQRFLKQLINHFSNERIAVVVNEYGSESIDALEYKQLNLSVSDINNGSIFCSCKSAQFLNVLLELYQLGIERVLVESSGLSDPYSLGSIFTLLENKMAKPFTELNIVTLIDSTSIHKVINTLQLVRRQIEVSNVLILNKIDLVDESKKTEIKQVLEEINPFAKIIETEYAKVSLEEIQYSRVDSVLLPKEIQVKNLLLDSISVSLEVPLLDKVNQLLEILNDKVYRIKGHFNHQYQVNTTFNDIIEIKKCETNLDSLVFLFNKSLITEEDILKIITDLQIKIKEPV